jgi:hypothetical protein
MSRKKIFFFSTIAIAATAIVFILYFITVFRAESLLEKIVNNQSNGTLFLKVDKVNLNIFHLRFGFQNTELRTIDSSNAVSGYHIKIDKVSFKVHSLLSLFTNKPVIIDSVVVQTPLIEVFKYKDREGPPRKISLPDEMNKVYVTLEEILKVLNLNYLHISDAKFRIYDRSKPDTRPLQLSNLNLTIDNVSDESGEGKNRFLHADRILLEIYNQDILLPDGFHSIKFKRFWMGTRSQMIKLDSCYIYSKPADSLAGEFSIFIDSLRIKKLDFNLLTKENTIKFDSALCINPDISFKLHLKDKGKKLKLTDTYIINPDSVDHKLKKMLGNLDIGYLTVRNASINIITEKNNKTKVYNTKNSNFSIGALVVDNDPAIPIKLGLMDINVHDYTGYSPDSMYVVKFDDIIIREKKIRLNNFRIDPSKSNHDPLRKEIKMQAFELDDIDWMELFLENRIEAGHASLISPDVHLVLPGEKNSSAQKEKANPFTILSQIQHKIQIGELFIEDGNLKFEVIKGPAFSLDHCYAGISVNQLLLSDNEFRLIDALDSLSFSRGNFHNPAMQVTLSSGSYSKLNRTLQIGRIVQGKTDQSQSVTLTGLRLGGIYVNSLNDISLTEIAWAKANVDLDLGVGEKNNSNSAKSSIDYKVVIDKLTGGQTDFKVKSENIEASTKLNQVATGEIIVQSGQKPQISGLLIDGQSVNLNQGNNMKGSLDAFHIADNRLSSFNNVLVRMPLNGEMASILIPKLTFSADIYKSMNGKISADFIELSHPSISFSPVGVISKPDTTHSQKKPAGLPVLNIRRITIDQPELVNLPVSLSGRMHFKPGKSKLDLFGVNSDSTSLKVDSIRVSASEPFFETEKVKLIPTGKEKVDLRASALVFKPANQQSKSSWSVNLTTLKLEGLQLNTLQNDSVNQTIFLNNLNLENLHVNDSSFNKPGEFISKNNSFRISNGNIRMENTKTNLAVYNLSFSKATNSLALDSMIFKPVPDREAFMKTQSYQATHIEVHSGKINVKDIDFNLLLADTVISLKKVTISDMNMLAFKDKRLPFHHGVYKPMLTDLLLNIKPKIQADSVILKNGLIEYEEFNDKTQQFGKIKLSRIKGAIGGVRTFNPKPDDSLKFNVYARLIDTADLRIKYKQSYTDSLSGFNIKLIVNSFNLTALNPILRPFASAELKSGNLDTIRMSAIGRKYIAYGTMKMYYYDLNAQMLVKGDSSAKTVVTRSISFFANRIVHTKNRRGTGDVFAERDPEKGFVNYWVKIVIGGVLTNSGVRTDKKQQRKYKRALNNHDVPPIPDIPVDY